MHIWAGLDKVVLKKIFYRYIFTEINYKERGMEKREILKETELFVLDMDGTFYLDTDVLDRALDFLEEVKKAGKRYVFLRIIRRNLRKHILTNWQNGVLY